MRPILLVLLPLLLWANAEAVTFRYAEPPLGRLVFNQILDGAVTAPLRLPKIGEYYAELIIEAADGQQEVVLNEPLALSLDVSVARREHALLSRSVTVNFAPGRTRQDAVLAERARPSAESHRSRNACQPA